MKNHERQWSLAVSAQVSSQGKISVSCTSSCEGQADIFIMDQIQLSGNSDGLTLTAARWSMMQALDAGWLSVNLLLKDKAVVAKLSNQSNFDPSCNKLLLNINRHIITKNKLRIPNQTIILLILNNLLSRLDYGLKRRVVKRRNRPSCPVPFSQNPVPSALIPPITQHLNLITRVYNNRVFNGLDFDPRPVFQDLEPTYLDHAASIRVGPKPVNFFGGPTWRVVAHLGPEEGPIFVFGPTTVEGPVDVTFREAQILVHYFHYSDREFL
ncbi:tubulin beta-1 chain [Striga asiatica]|uniref:Tubulin beta-1 chain n=1 Tax=Striga asiatica TaxID=4170 RepID=A0A5A7PXY1_STRAF|nr:tubulin beta-1 chain [Striga asiatica]